MKQAKKGKKTTVFHKETIVLESVKEVLAKEGGSELELREAYGDLAHHYEKLLKDTKVLTSVSDRLHSKLNDANKKLQDQKDQIGEINEELTVNNQVLQDTVDMLVEARVSQRATSIVLLIAIALFIVSEVWLEPIIEQNTSSEYIGLLLKGVIALLLKPIDILVERLLMKHAIKGVNAKSWVRLKRRT